MEIDAYRLSRSTNLTPHCKFDQQESNGGLELLKGYFVWPRKELAPDP